ncbi:DUF3592 domain-containing protein [bacterium D16-51]|nr:DUF3592 domain-containing protein [bacterium D16-59]RKI57894.1 DUF3592 domain-containing protein [bacterium D16-51]
MNSNTSSQDHAQKLWRFFVIFWPLLCFTFAGTIIFQSGLKTEKSLVGVGFTIIPLVFFAIGMSIRRRLLKERKYATARTTATVISVESRPAISEGNKRVYIPIYEFQVGKDTYQVKSPAAYGNIGVSRGQVVDLYYNPRKPQMFYVPIMQKRDNRWSVLLCGVGIIYPLIGVFSQFFTLP